MREAKAKADEHGGGRKSRTDRCGLARLSPQRAGGIGRRVRPIGGAWQRPPGSATLSHLFSQGYNSAYLVRTDRAFVRGCEPFFLDLVAKGTGWVPSRRDIDESRLIIADAALVTRLTPASRARSLIAMRQCHIAAMKGRAVAKRRACAATSEFARVVLINDLRERGFGGVTQGI